METSTAIALALCLSVPPSVALVYAAAMIVIRMREADRSARTERQDVLTSTLRYVADAVAKGAHALADAHVKSARYHAGAITVKPRPPEKSEPTLFQHWLDGGGSMRSEAIQGRVEWAILRLLGEEGDEQGSLEKATAILDTDAPGFAVAAIRERERRAKSPDRG